MYSLFIVTILLLLTISESKYILISTIGLALKTNNMQLGGALRNPLAIGTEIVSCMRFGTNTISKMVNRASHELRQLCIAMGGNPRTINRLAGMGDLMITCFSCMWSMLDEGRTSGGHTKEPCGGRNCNC